MYENIQEEKLDTLTDELVTCIAGEEGAGGKINMIFLWLQFIHLNI